MARKSKPLNHARRLRAAETAKARKGRDLNALALIVSRKGGSHGDARKERSRKACRGRVDY
jgi:hypothetical protein